MELPVRAAAAGIVLAGGRSTRMGRAKALLPLGDRPLVGHVVAALAAVVDEIVVVAAPGQRLPRLEATVVEDRVAYQGPMSGIRNGMAAVRAPVSFVAPCDCAFLSPALVSHLLECAAAFDVVVPRWGQRLQPLHAVYRPSVAPLLDEALASGERRPAALFGRLRTRVVEEDEIRACDPEGLSFLNINTPADYREALGRLSRPPVATPCTVELFGFARRLAGSAAIPLALPAGARVADVLAALAERHPRLVGRVIRQDRRTLTEGYACSVNGTAFVRAAAVPVAAGDSVLIVPAEAGG